jgi:pyridoxamine 5'-phosphate oxidase
VGKVPPRLRRMPHEGIATGSDRLWPVTEDPASRLTRSERTGFVDLDPDPLRQFGAWLADAQAEDSIREPNAMAVASVGEHGWPSVRMVLMRGYDERGFCFFTNFESQKGRELDALPRAAAVFYWDPLVRQVRLVGQVERATDAESDAYHAGRARGSQIAAWASDQSRPIDDRAALEARYAEAVTRLGDAPIPRPPYWGGYRIVPDRFEFWQGRENRLHDRLAYQRQPDGSWTRGRLMP